MKQILERASVACPPSIALDVIERYLRSRANVLDLLVPLKALSLPSALALERSVTVVFETDRHQKLVLGRHPDRLALRWKPQGDGPYPTFNGALTIHPLSGGTELELKGEYEPPFGTLGAAFDAVAGNRAARATARALLGELKGELEREFATIKDSIALAPSGEPFRSSKR